MVVGIKHLQFFNNIVKLLPVLVEELPQVTRFLVHLDLDILVLSFLASHANDEAHEVAAAEDRFSMLAVVLELRWDGAAIGVTALFALVREDRLRVRVGQLPDILYQRRERLRGLDLLVVVLRGLRHQVQAQRDYKLDVPDVLLLLLYDFEVLFAIVGGLRLLKVVLPQRVRHATLIENGVYLSQVVMIEFFASRKFLPKSELFAGDEAKVGDLPFVQGGLGSAGCSSCEVGLLP